MKLSWRYLTQVLILAAACLAAGWLGLAFSYEAIQGGVIWLPAGIALAALLRYGYRLWPGVFIGQLLLSLQLPAAELVAATLGSTLSALLGAWLLKNWPHFDLRIARIRELLALILLGGVLPAGLKSSLLLFGAGADSDNWLIWWMGDAAGVLLMTPLLLTLRPPGWKDERPSRLIEGGLALLSLATVSALVFGDLLPLDARGDLPLAFLPAPPLIWIAMRLPLRWAALAVLLVSAISMLGTKLGHGPFVRESITESLVLLWSFMVVDGLLALLLCAGIASLREMADRLRLIVEANPNAILLTDRDGRIVQVNAQCKQLFGYRSAELVGQPVEMMLPERYRRRHAGYHRGFIESVDARPMGAGRHLFAMRRDGSEIPVEVGLAAFGSEEGGGVLAVVTDITERLEAEQALRQERNFLSTMLDTTDALMLVLDCDWRIVRFNRACQKVSGYDEAEVLGRSFWELGIIPESELPAVEATAQGTRSGVIHDYWENHWRHRNGELHLISWSSGFIRDEGGDIEYLIGTGTDITARRRAEEQLKLWQSRLVHMDRLATAAEMASGLAHELNQPLTAIGNYSDVALMLIRASAGPDGQLLHAIEQMDRQAQRAGSIIRHLRDFVGKAGSDSDWVDLNALVREVVEFVEADIRRTGADIRLELADCLPRLWLDRVQIEQVLVNLVRNACEAMEAAGSEPRQLTLRTALDEGDRVRISVRDTGPGVDPVIREQLFRPFETTKPQGLGMGLAISRSIVEARGGRLWLDDEAGTAFHFTLPYSPPEAPDAQ